ncbi:MAG: SPOR domain-containing protein [Flavobacteriaceae bacterium]|nr:SPOR domain-containing protein [Flavobacteriaceae bacterium]
MTLETYITDLLYRYDCVIVPNFGAFIANRKSATINVNTFSPPYKQVTFNSLIQNNDGLLINYIAQVDKTPYEMALNYVNFKVQEWLDQLLNDEINLKGLGSLFLINDKVQFEPEKNINYLTTAFGLSQFISDDIQRTKSILVKSKKEVIPLKSIPVLENKRVVYKEQVESLEEKTPIYLTLEKRKKTVSFIKYAAIFVLSASVLGMANKIHQNTLEKQQIAILKESQKVREAKIQKATFIIDTPLPTIILNTNKIKKYHIIAGAFRSKINADKKVDQLLNQDFNAKVIGKNKWNLTQVAFSSFASLENANVELAKIKKTIASDAWLLVKE